MTKLGDPEQKLVKKVPLTHRCLDSFLEFTLCSLVHIHICSVQDSTSPHAQ